MRQRTRADVGHPGLTDGVHRLQRHVPARLGLHPPVDELHRLPHQLARHVVQHHPAHGARVDGVVFEQRDDLPHLVHGPGLHLDLDAVHALLLEERVAVGDSLVDAAGRRDVVILDHDHVEESHAVVLAAADEHRPLVGESEPRDGLARLEHVRGGRGVGHGLGEGRDAAHALHEVEEDALGAEDGVSLARHLAEEFPFGDDVAVDLGPRDGHLRIDRGEDLVAQRLAREHAVGLRQERRGAHGSLGDPKTRGVGRRSAVGSGARCHRCGIFRGGGDGAVVS